MIGGVVQQVVDRGGFRFIEVLDDETYGDRCWRSIDPAADVIEGDRVWWQSFTLYRTRTIRDEDVGRCKPSDGPARIREPTDA